MVDVIIAAKIENLDLYFNTIIDNFEKSKYTTQVITDVNELMDVSKEEGLKALLLDDDLVDNSLKYSKHIKQYFPFAKVYNFRKNKLDLIPLYLEDAIITSQENYDQYKTFLKIKNILNQS